MTSRDGAATEDLTRALRDVLGLLALPALWRTRAPHEILTTLAEAMEAALSIDLVLTTTNDGDGNVSVARVHGSDAGGLVSEVQSWLGAAANARASTVAKVNAGEHGTMNAVIEPFGYNAANGLFVVASARATFPTLAELVTIRAAAALATTALETARATREREEALRAKDAFLAMLGHELRNPLAPITTALEIMRRRSGGEASREEQVIARQVEHLTRLVDDLLDIARVTRGLIDLKRETLEVADIVDKGVEMAAPLFELRGHTLTVDVPRQGLPVYADALRLRQVVANLLTNAAKYTPPGGHVSVRAERKDERVVLSVRDDGAGIAPGLLPKIFDLFVQGRPSSDPQYGGLGIGLTLVRNLVLLHGGSISASSEGQGRGSEFTVELPIGSRQVSEPAFVAPEPPRKSLRILVVDDNRDAVEMLGEALAMGAHDVTVLEEPLEALARLEQSESSFDVVILDIGMPVMDGYELASRIKAAFGERAPAMVALTGYGQAGDRERARIAGFAAHLVKPVDLTLLERCIGDVTRHD